MSDQVIFKLSNQLYCVNSLRVIGIEAKLPVNTLANAPGIIKGIVSLRGETHPVCSIYKYLNLPENPEALQTILVNTDAGIIGFEVDGVKEICTIDDKAESTLPNLFGTVATGYVEGIIRHKDELITVINPNNLLNDSEKKFIRDELNKSTES